MVDNRRCAVAESYLEFGETTKAEALFEQWLAADPRCGWGWIGWADLHFFTNNRPKDYNRFEALDAAKPSIGPRRATKVGRNAPCPCGSGRKYKKCCGSGPD